MFKEKDIPDLSTNFSGRTQDNGKIHFGIRRTKSMKALIDRVEDFYFIPGDPTIVEMNEVMFMKQLDTALYRAKIRKNIIDQSNTKAKEYYSGPLDSDNKLKEWESKSIKYLSTLIGFNVVPLTYIMRFLKIQMQIGTFPVSLTRQ